MLGFYFNGQHSDDFKIRWKTESRPFLPAARIVEETVPDRDGSYDFSTLNTDGRMHYENRVISGMISVLGAGNLQELHMRLTKIARWLMCGWSDLIFDDMPLTVWRARVENADQVVYRLARIGQATLAFTVQPFSRSLLSHGREMLLGDGIPLGSSLPLAGDVTEFSVTGNRTITVHNRGDWYTRPQVTVTGTYTYLEIKRDDTRHIRYYGGSAAGNTVLFDFDTCQISKDGAFDNLHSLGEFFDLAPGENSLQILTDGSAILSFDLTYYYIYGAEVIG